MKEGSRLRFWLETGVASITGILFVVTLAWRNWLEILFHVDPDLGDGSLEWFIVGGLLLVTIVLFVMAHKEWRSARAVAAIGHSEP